MNRPFINVNNFETVPIAGGIEGSLQRLSLAVPDSRFDASSWENSPFRVESAASFGTPRLAATLIEARREKYDEDKVRKLLAKALGNKLSKWNVPIDERRWFERELQNLQT